MAKGAGSLWVEGGELHYVSASGAEWYMQGEYISVAGGQPGSLWIGPDAYMYYVGANGLKYRVPLQNMHSDAAVGTTQASIWVEGNYLFHSIGNAKYWGHGDYSHSDGGSGGHTDTVHTDSHQDGSHGDFHGDGHTDSGHGDGHTDAAHGDATESHGDGHSDSFTVGPPGPMHQDGTYKFWGDPPAYAPGTHTDIHYDNTNYTSETAHNDTHFDSAVHTDGSHGDSHSDASHGDSHNDQAHIDSGHGDQHLDSAHGDHTDGAASHWDTPTYIGP